MIMRYLLYGILALGLIAAIVLGVQKCKQVDQDNKNVLVNAGVDAERSATQSEVINNVEKANNAVRDATPADEQRVCEKYDRNCESRR